MGVPHLVCSDWLGFRQNLGRFGKVKTTIYHYPDSVYECKSIFLIILIVFIDMLKNGTLASWEVCSGENAKHFEVSVKSQN